MITICMMSKCHTCSEDPTGSVVMIPCSNVMSTLLQLRQTTHSDAGNMLWTSLQSVSSYAQLARA